MAILHQRICSQRSTRNSTAALFDYLPQSRENRRTRNRGVPHACHEFPHRRARSRCHRPGPHRLPEAGRQTPQPPPAWKLDEASSSSPFAFSGSGHRSRARTPAPTSTPTPTTSGWPRIPYPRTSPAGVPSRCWPSARCRCGISWPSRWQHKPPRRASAKIVADFWATGMDEKKLNAEGMAPLQDRLAEIDPLTDGASVAEHLRKVAARGENPLFGFGPDADFNDSIDEHRLCRAGRHQPAGPRSTTSSPSTSRHPRRVREAHREGAGALRRQRLPTRRRRQRTS